MWFLFRIDMAKENEEFQSLRRARQEYHVYSGITLRIGQGWVPDFVELSIEVQPSACRITLVELEATDIMARVSCRKYLPEDSGNIVKAFLAYLETVIAQCKTTSDPRLAAFENLRNALAEHPQVRIFTAGALRTSADFIEEFPLLDQPAQVAVPRSSTLIRKTTFDFSGVRRVTRAESDGLRRSVRFLHAVFVGQDHSATTLKSWRGIRTKPLDLIATNEKGAHPQL